MPRTDYSKIARVYDRAPDRRAWPDRHLGERLRAARGRKLTVLDLGCGTGNWLAVQMEAFGGAASWFGIDRSAQMLAHARRKAPQARLAIGTAENLPYRRAAIDLLASAFAFHHFEDKGAALDEMARVLAEDGSLRMTNLCPEHMPGWWVYRYFPGTAARDAARYWPAARIHDALVARGLSPAMRVTVRYHRSDPQYLRERVALKDISQIANLSHDELDQGLRRLSGAIAAGSPVSNQVAFIDCVARRGAFEDRVDEFSVEQD